MRLCCSKFVLSLSTLARNTGSPIRIGTKTIFISGPNQKPGCYPWVKALDSVEKPVFGVFIERKGEQKNQQQQQNPFEFLKTVVCDKERTSFFNAL